MRRGQAALEYLLTYGWAFIVILVTVGALAYFGLINPSQWVPEKCEFGSQLQCVDWAIEENAGDIYLFLLLRNNFGKDIQITDMAYLDDEGNELGGFNLADSGSPIVVKAGQTNDPDSDKILKIDDADTDLKAGEKPQLTLQVELKRDAPGAETHVIRGILYSEIQ